MKKMRLDVNKELIFKDLLFASLGFALGYVSNLFTVPL
jgi:hypothetical protein